MVKVNANEPIVVLYNTCICLETVKVKLLDLLYLTIVQVFVLVRNIISINTYTTILMRVFLILLFSVECISIYVVPLIFHNDEYRATSQLF
jgi:hypothetical protein